MQRKFERQAGEDYNTCLLNIEVAMNYSGKQRKNFMKQKIGTDAIEKLMKNKGSKKDSFQNTTRYMKEALGSDDSCNGATNKK